MIELIILGGIVLLTLWVVLIYNGLVRLKNEVDNSFAQIDVQLKRRNDLIPNLVETVKGYAAHEKTVLENITKARSALPSRQTSSGKKLSFPKFYTPPQKHRRLL
ncbi:MAG: LemA family protein, partial [Candidatus Altiarchaeota archaeon]|nr:LemA family protein [Candidatus Altiarchaeota archaeon]